MKQSTSEWLNWRSQGICASEISALMSSNPWKNALNIFELKCGYKKENFINAAMQHGIDNEHNVRTHMNLSYGLDLQPICIEDDDRPYFKASLDGFDINSKFLCEMKCPSSEKILNDAKYHQKIPAYWMDQVQWQIMLCNPTRSFITLRDHRTVDYYDIEIFRDQNRIDEMKNVAESFWFNLQRGIPPKSKYENFENPMLKNLLNEYHRFSIKEKECKKLKDDMKKEILNIVDRKEIACNGFTISKIKARTSYDIDAMIADGIDVNKYLKLSEESDSFRIKTPKFSSEHNVLLC